MTALILAAAALAATLTAVGITFINHGLDQSHDRTLTLGLAAAIAGNLAAAAAVLIALYDHAGA